MVKHTYPIDILVKKEDGIHIGLLTVCLGHYCNDHRWYIDSCNKRGETGQETIKSLQEL